MILWWIVAFADSSFLICNVIETEAWYNLRSNLHNLQRKLNRQKKTMLLFISDDYGSNLENLRTKILVPSVVSVSVRAHVMRVMLRGVIFHLYTIWGPFPYMEWPPLDFKFMSTTEMCCQHILTIKRTVAGEWIIYMCRYWLFNMFFKGRIFPAREGEGESRSAEIINCGGRKNGLSRHDLIVIFCDINYSIFILQ